MTKLSKYEVLKVSINEKTYPLNHNQASDNVCVKDKNIIRKN